MIASTLTQKLSLPALTLPDWEAEAAVRRDIPRLNRTQVRYQGMSKVNPTGAAAPAVLAPMMLQSLERLYAKVGDIDEWVAGNLRWSQTEMASRLASEQVDAVALAMDAMNEQTGFLVADVTGFGKGRIAACVARYSALMGRRVVFFTEKANLFSDFWRDIRDIGSEDVFGRPFMLNWGSGAKAVRIVDTSSSEGRIIFPAMKKTEIDTALREGIPADVRLVMTTYTQFNRPGRKTEWLESIAKGSHLMLDEGHNQAGDSSTSKNIAPALEASASSTYSTATAGRDVTNLMAYRSVFPWLLSIGDPELLTGNQKQGIAEASVREACAAGRIVRREHDLSNMILELMIDEKGMERSEKLSDALAPILSKMARLSNKVYATIERRNEAAKDAQGQLPPSQKKAASEFWFAANFGSRLNNLIGQFLVALKVDATVEACISDILEGIKPVIVIESTMESLMRELSKEPTEEEAALDEDEALEQDVDEDAVENIAPDARPPTYGEALRVMANRLLRVSVRRGGPDGEKEVLELDDPDMITMRDEIIAFASEFPELSLSPIDDIRERVEAEGRRLYSLNLIPAPWVMDEISARSMRVLDGKYVPMGNKDRNISVARFNNGDTHGIILTNAASTGLSLHDAPQWLQHARRRMYELRAPRNVVQRIQMWGRVFRRGQLTEPEFRILSTGMDAEMFDLAVQNRKVQGLSASVTGDGGAGLVVAARDYEDSLGNAITYDLLMENPNLADDMAISLKVEKDEGDKSLYWISKLLRRLWLVGKKDRKFLYSTLQEAYEERLNAGAPTADGTELPGEWRMVSRRLLEKGDGLGDPLSNADVYVTDIEQDRIADPIGVKELEWLVRHADKDYLERLGRLPSRLREEGPAAMKALLGRRLRSVERAMKEEGENPIKRMARTVKSMGFLIGQVRPGVSSILPGEDGEPTRAVVVDVRFPVEGGDIFSPRQWAISYAVPGEDELRVVTLDILLADGRMRIGTRAEGLEMKEKFDAAPRGESVTRRRLIDGSPLGSVMASVRLGSGARVSYRDGFGGLHDGILLSVSGARRVISVPGITTTSEGALAVLQADGRLVSSYDLSSAVEMRPWTDGRSGNRVIVTVPGAKKHARIWQNELLATAVKGWHELEGRKQAIVSRDDLPNIMNALRGMGIALMHEPEYRTVVQRALMSVADAANQPACK